MANKNLGFILLSGLLTLGTAPFAFPQSGQGNMRQSTSSSQQSSSTTTKSQTTTPDQSGNQMSSHKTAKQSMRQVQTALKGKGFDPGPVDGIMGPQTQKAIEDFQRQNNLYASGKLDTETKNALGVNLNHGTTGINEETGREKPSDVTPKENAIPDRQLNNNNDQNSQPDQNQLEQQKLNQDEREYQNQQAPGVRPDMGQNSGQSNAGVGTASSVEDIRQAQMALKNRGFDPGEINGMLSSETQDAIRKFQSANNLPVTGVLDDRTQAALGMNIKGNAKPDTLHNQGLNSQPQDNNDVSAMGPSAMTQEADPPATPKPMRDEETNKKLHEYHERASKAGEVLASLTNVGDNGIPDSLLARAEAIAVIPDMIKGAFGIGGRYGKGLVAERLADGRWGGPAFLEISGGSFGAQLGVSSTDLVLIFTDAHAINSLRQGMSLKLGVDAGVSAGPIGREAEAGVSQNVKGGIFAYSRSKGLFAGIALDGAVLDIDKTANRHVYGANMDADTIMRSPSMASNVTVRPFMRALEAAVPSTRRTTR